MSQVRLTVSFQVSGGCSRSELNSVSAELNGVSSGLIICKTSSALEWGCKLKRSVCVQIYIEMCQVTNFRSKFGP